MSAALLSPPDAAVDWLCAHVAANLFLPVPPPHIATCGDGDYRAIGAEFLGHFVREARLRPEERVLDLGCGVGRMAIPLTQYLRGTGGYQGLDVDARAIGWCADTITPAYPSFRFAPLDIAHPLYNPAGSIPAEALELPFADATFDVALMVSLLTHLEMPAIERYAAEVKRVLAPGGRVFATAFLLNGPSRAAIAAGTARPSFPDRPDEPVLFAIPEAPLAAVAFDEDTLLAAFLRAGLRRRRPAVYGGWSGRPHGRGFQDICILEHA